VRLLDLPFLPAWPPVVGPLGWVAVLLFAAILAGEAARRWLGTSRVIGYLAVGCLLGPQLAGVIDRATLVQVRVVVDIAFGLLLFDLGQRVDLGWLRRNPWLLVISVLEAALTFVAVFALMTLFGVRPVAAAAASVIAVATSAAVVITAVKDLRAQGQVTERVLLFTALNTAYAVVGLTLMFGWLHFESASPVLTVLLHPLYLLAGSLLLAGALAWVLIRLLRAFGRRTSFQFALTLAMVLLTVALAGLLRLSVPLALLALGVLARLIDRERHFVSLRFPETAMLFVVLLFALTGASLEFRGWAAALPLAVGIVGARFVGKLLPVLLLARPSSITLRKASLINFGLAPMSALALLMLDELTREAPRVAQEIAAGMHLAITILAFAGPPLLHYALRAAGEAVADDRGNR
jgi:Kef-type K+ transport system membrane component KefB